MAELRDPAAAPTPLDWASFYVEDLKYGRGPRQLEGATVDQFAAQLEALLRDAGCASMTGSELARALDFYGLSAGRAFRLPAVIAYSLFADGLMHGLALAGGLRGAHPEARRNGGTA